MAPKPIESLRVMPALKVFSDKTLTALKTHPGMAGEDTTGTQRFIEIVTSWWKTVNVKSVGLEKRFKDPRRAAIFDTEDPRLTEIEKFGDMILEMGTKGKKRFNELTRDTAKAVHHTSHGLVELAKYLLSTSHRYILLGLFSTDQL